MAACSATMRSRWLMPPWCRSGPCACCAGRPGSGAGRPRRAPRYGHAEDATVDAQLLLGADTVTVGGDQREAAGAVAHHAACGELGGGGGLADPGGADQGIHATTVEQILVRPQARIMRSSAAPTASRASMRSASSCTASTSLRAIAGEAGLEQFAEHRRRGRLATGLAPGETGELPLDHAADAGQLGHQAGVGLLQLAHPRAADSSVSDARRHAWRTPRARQRPGRCRAMRSRPRSATRHRGSGRHSRQSRCRGGLKAHHRSGLGAGRATGRAALRAALATPAPTGSRGSRRRLRCAGTPQAQP